MKRRLAIPENKDLLEALGVLTYRHAQLDHILRLTYGTLEGLENYDALDQTKQCRSSYAYREKVKKSAEKALKPCSDDAYKKLENLLCKCRKITDERNKYVHGLWGAWDGKALLKDKNYSWSSEDVPKVSSLNALSEKIFYIAEELESARQFDGFIGEALANK